MKIDSIRVAIDYNPARWRSDFSNRSGAGEDSHDEKVVVPASAPCTRHCPRSPQLELNTKAI